jgi:hypothetical protein
VLKETEEPNSDISPDSNQDSPDSSELSGG